MAHLNSLAALVGGQVVGDPHLDIEDLADLHSAGPQHLSFLANPKYAKLLETTRAGAVLVKHAFESVRFSQIVCADPYVAMAQIGMALHPPAKISPGIHPAAVVAADAAVDPSASVGACAVIESGARVGARSHVGAGCYVGAKAVLGEDVFLHPRVSVLERCKIGHRSIMHSGTVIGADGFGYAENPDGSRRKIPQLGTVEIGDDVEIGANCTLDRATFGVTRIGNGCKIDNLVQIAHNVTLGKNCVIVSQSGIAGSTRVGDHVIMGAQVGVVGHLEIGDNVVFGARAAPTHSIKEPGIYSGVPAVEHARWLRAAAAQYQVPELRRRVRALEETLANLPTQGS